MNKFFLLICGVLTTFGLASQTTEERDFAALFGDRKNCDCECISQCDELFCECMPFFLGQVDSTTQFPTAMDLSNPNFSGVIKVPIVSMDGFGGGYTVKNQPLCENSQIIAPANRVDICHCGWFKVGFFGQVINTTSQGHDQTGAGISNPITIMLRSPILGDMHIATVNTIFDNSRTQNPLPIPIPVAATAYKYVTKFPHCCAPMYFTLEISNVLPFNIGGFVQFSPNTVISIERIGPCSCCPKTKPCCPGPCKNKECEKKNERND